MFLYFIQRKRWLGGDTNFLRTFWESYRSANRPDDSFVDRWLNVLFFEAFNNRFHGGHRQFPDDIRKALASAPYLNGGLFTEIDLMCRLALVDNLANHLGEEYKPALYQAVFAFDPDDKTDADKKLIESNLWDSIGQRLSGIAIVDPACGSRAFLSGYSKSSTTCAIEPIERLDGKHPVSTARRQLSEATSTAGRDGVGVPRRGAAPLAGDHH